MSFVTIASFANGIEAEIVAARLRAEEIPVVVRGNDTGIFGAGFQGWNSRGWDVLVPEEIAEVARVIISPANHEPAEESDSAPPNGGDPAPADDPHES